MLFGELCGMMSVDGEGGFIVAGVASRGEEAVGGIGTVRC